MQQTHGQIEEYLGCQFGMHIHRGTQASFSDSSTSGSTT